MKTSLYKTISAALAAVFALVGALFLFRPDAVMSFMNGIGRGLGFAPAPLAGAGFYQGLAVGYMYVVTVLAVMMFRNPASRVLPFLLAQAKGASGALSIGLLLFQGHYLVYLANGVVDLSLCALAVVLYRTRKASREAAAP